MWLRNGIQDIFNPLIQQTSQDLWVQNHPSANLTMLAEWDLLSRFKSRRKCWDNMNKNALPRGARQAIWQNSAYVWNFIPSSPFKWRVSIRSEPRCESKRGNKPLSRNSETSLPSSKARMTQSRITSRPVWSIAATFVRKVFFHALNSDAVVGKFSSLTRDKPFERYTSFSDMKPNTFDPIPIDALPRLPYLPSTEKCGDPGSGPFPPGPPPLPPESSDDDGEESSGSSSPVGVFNENGSLEGTLWGLPPFLSPDPDPHEDGGMLGLYTEHADKPGLWNGNWNMHWRLCDNRNGRSMLKHTKHHSAIASSHA